MKNTTARRHLRAEIRNSIDRIEIALVTVMFAYLAFRCFLFVVGIDL